MIGTGIFMLLFGLAGTLANRQIALLIRDQRTTPAFMLSESSKRMKGSASALLVLRVLLGVITVGITVGGLALIVQSL